MVHIFIYPHMDSDGDFPMIPIEVAEIMLEQLVGKYEARKIMKEVRREVFWKSIFILILCVFIVSFLVIGGLYIVSIPS